MSDDFLSERRRGAEEAFFARQNEALRRDLRERAAPDDAGAPDGRAEHESARQDAAMLSLVPLAAVAWADGTLGDGERALLVDAIGQADLALGQQAEQVASGWLRAPPDRAAVEAWRRAIAGQCAALAPQDRAGFGRAVLNEARRMAEASGGILGLGRVSEAERAMLADLASAFEA